MAVDRVPDETGVGVLRLVAIMDRLRSPGGCPWDERQTHESLAEYLLEETYETLAAIEHGTAGDLVEELGDLLLQVVFHARLGQEESPSWDIDDVADGICRKLIRRHPYVRWDDRDFFEDASQFGNVARLAGAVVEPGRDVAVGPEPESESGDLDQLAANWTRAKAQEKGRSSALDGIPRSMPALAQAQKTWRRAIESGVSLAQPRVTAQPADQQELGDRLMSLVVAAEESGLDAEAALRSGIEQTRRRIQEAEAQADTFRDDEVDSG